MSTGVQRRSPKIAAREAGDLYSSPQQQSVMDHPSRMNSFEMSAAEKTAAAKMIITRERGNLYSSPQKQCIQDHGFDTSAAENTKTAAQTSRRHNIDSICCVYVHSDHSETTIETCSSGGGGVCSEDSRTKSDSTASCSTSRITAISIQQQTQGLHTTVCPYFLDSADNLINLPDDLIREVLRRLNVKEIVRMGCLNRSWRSELQRIIDDEGHNFSQPAVALYISHRIM